MSDGLAIDLKGVVKKFGSDEVLHGIDLEVPAGLITVLLGPSGAGKTVTIKHILGLIRPTSGFVRVEGQNLSRLSEDELNDIRRGMSAVLQGTLPFSCGLFFSLDVYENVAFPLRDRTRWNEERIEAVTMARLDEVGMREQARLMPEQLSSGMAKRVALARALALEARLVIIDDFDSGIDGVRLALLCELIRDTQRATGATYLLSTHDMKAARKLADHVAIIHEGHVVANGPAPEVFGSSEPLARQLVTGDTAGPIRLRDT